MAKRPYKPTAVRNLEGMRSHSLPKPEEAEELEPKPESKVPECPKDIDDDAKRAWFRLAPKLVRLNLLTEIDGDSFAILCQIRSRLKAIHEFIKKDNASLVQEIQKPDPDGGTRTEYKPSPYAVMEKQYYQLFRMAASEFGLTPRSRVGLSVGSQKSKDKMESLID